MVSAIPKGRSYYNGKRRYNPYRRRGVPMKRVSLAKKVNNLSKAVSLNRKLAYGHIQRNLQIASATLIPTATYPICFQASNFAQGGTNAPIYQITTTGTIGSAAHWSPYDIISNGYWSQDNSDIPDTGQYRALYANYRFKIEGNPSLDATNVRIDFIQPRASSFRNATSSSQALALPQSLSALGGLCNHNMYNPVYFKIIATKRVILDSTTSVSNIASSPGNTTSTGHTSTTSNVRFCNFMVKINKNIYQATSGTNFNYQNTAFANQIWCVISTDDAVATGSDKVQITCTRQVVWRDTKGSASL